VTDTANPVTVHVFKAPETAADAPISDGVGVTTPPVVKPKRTRKEILADKRAYSKAWREKKKLEAAATTESNVVPTVDSRGDTVVTGGDTQPPVTASVEPSPEHVAMVERQLAEGVELLATSYLLLAVHPDAPGIGKDRADLIAKSWGQYVARWVPPGGNAAALVLASVATGGTVISWQREVSSWAEQHPEKVPPKPPKSR
jgi:hypothetical protein